MVHTPACLEDMNKEYEAHKIRMDREYERLQQAGVDISGRGWGHQWKCICKTQETQHE